MDQDTQEGNSPNPSGAPEAGGATTAHSLFGGSTFPARLWRFLARVARDLESTAYRRLKEMERRAPQNEARPGAPRRAREAEMRIGDEPRIRTT